MKIGVIGAGRIGKVHIKNISLFVPELTIKTVADPFANEQTEAFAKQFGIANVTKNADEILNDPEIEAVAICSSTDTHAKYIIEAAKAGVKLQIGFVRRFDHNHRAIWIKFATPRK